MRRLALAAALLAAGCGTRGDAGAGRDGGGGETREQALAEASRMWSAAMAGPQREWTLFRRAHGGVGAGACRQLTAYRTEPIDLDLAAARDQVRRGCDPRMAVAYSVMLRDLDGIEADLGRARGGTCGTEPPGDDELLAPVRMALGLGDRPRAERALAALTAIDDAELRCGAGLIAAQLAASDGQVDDARTRYAAIRGTGLCGLAAEARRGAPAGPPVPVTGTLELPPGVTARVALVAVAPGDELDAQLVSPRRLSFWLGGERRDEAVAVVAHVGADGRIDARVPPGTWMLEVELDRRADPASKLTVRDDACWPLLSVAAAPVALPPLRFAVTPR